jgi:hypothetical protein
VVVVSKRDNGVVEYTNKGLEILLSRKLIQVDIVGHPPIPTDSS